MNLQAVDVIIGALIAMVGTLASPLVMSRSERKVRRYERMADAYVEGMRRLVAVSQADDMGRRDAYSALLEASIEIRVSGSRAGSRVFTSITNLVGEFNQRTWDSDAAALISELTEEFTVQVRRDVGTERRRGTSFTSKFAQLLRITSRRNRQIRWSRRTEHDGL